MFREKVAHTTTENAPGDEKEPTPPSHDSDDEGGVAEIFRRMEVELEGYSTTSCAVYNTSWMALSDGRIQVFDSESGEMIRTITPQRLNVSTITLLSVRRGCVWAGCSDGTIHVFDDSSGRLLKEITGCHSGKVTCLALSLDGQYAFSASEDGTIVQWDATYAEVVGSSFMETKTEADACGEAASSGHVRSVDTEDIDGLSIRSLLIVGSRLFTGRDNGEIVEWDYDRRAPLHVLGGDQEYHKSAVRHLILVGGLMWSASDDCTVRVWDINGSSAPVCVHVITDSFEESIDAMILVGLRVWIVSNGQLLIWNTTTFELETHCRTSTERNNSIYYASVAAQEVRNVVWLGCGSGRAISMESRCPWPLNSHGSASRRRQVGGLYPSQEEWASIIFDYGKLRDRAETLERALRRSEEEVATLRDTVMPETPKVRCTPVDSTHVQESVNEMVHAKGANLSPVDSGKVCRKLHRLYAAVKVHLKHCSGSATDEAALLPTGRSTASEHCIAASSGADSRIAKRPHGFVGICVNCSDDAGSLDAEVSTAALGFLTVDDLSEEEYNALLRIAYVAPGQEGQSTPSGKRLPLPPSLTEEIESASVALLLPSIQSLVADDREIVGEIVRRRHVGDDAAEKRTAANGSGACLEQVRQPVEDQELNSLLRVLDIVTDQLLCQTHISAPSTQQQKLVEVLQRSTERVKALERELKDLEARARQELENSRPCSWRDSSSESATQLASTITSTRRSSIRLGAARSATSWATSPPSSPSHSKEHNHRATGADSASVGTCSLNVDDLNDGEGGDHRGLGVASSGGSAMLLSPRLSPIEQNARLDVTALSSHALPSPNRAELIPPLSTTEPCGAESTNTDLEINTPTSRTRTVSPVHDESSVFPCDDPRLDTPTTSSISTTTVPAVTAVPLITSRPVVNLTLAQDVAELCEETMQQMQSHATLVARDSIDVAEGEGEPQELFDNASSWCAADLPGKAYLERICVAARSLSACVGPLLHELDEARQNYEKFQQENEVLKREVHQLREERRATSVVHRATNTAPLSNQLNMQPTSHHLTTNTSSRSGAGRSDRDPQLVNTPSPNRGRTREVGYGDAEEVSQSIDSPSDEEPDEIFLPLEFEDPLSARKGNDGVHATRERTRGGSSYDPRSVLNELAVVGMTSLVLSVQDRFAVSGQGAFHTLLCRCNRIASQYVLAMDQLLDLAGGHCPERPTAPKFLLTEVPRSFDEEWDAHHICMERIHCTEHALLCMRQQLRQLKRVVHSARQGHTRE